MEWLQFIIMILTFAGVFVWNRTESRADIRHMDAKLESNRALFESMHQENRQVIQSIQQEMKDFHGRLCSIEENRKKA